MRDPMTGVDIDKPFQPTSDGGPEDRPSGAVLWVAGALAVWIVTTIIFAAAV